jgi:hypothetical protein|nr:MAG: tail tube protein [Bacteriophage sp.]DAW11965.1 MAG TPA: Pvc1, Pvc9, Pvc11, Pvc12, Pvc4, Photorhabdus asymbiotica, PVC, contractile.5A [Caudoviricetes sp.]UVY51576.1 MAG: tail tube protein [Bacteriophage sp.]UWD62231.1 MAG: tail tube protein [Bacteriophage sp.]UWD69279.1 MAG: tail tube protein [Bacteriophage sp.]
MKPQKPQDVYVANGWYLNIPVPGIMSDAIFETLEGMQKQSGTVETVDAGTNRKYKFSTQLTDYGEMTLTRSYQGNVTDRALEILVNQMIENGLKLPVQAVKMHNGKEVFTIVFEGFRFLSANYPTFDISSEEKFTVSYGATCDGWDIIPVGA